MQTLINRFAGVQTARVIVVLPAFNEEASIAALIGSVNAALTGAAMEHEIVVVNDGSTDGTSPILERFARIFPSLHLIEHEQNQGLGATIRDGLIAAAAMANDNDIIVTMDADETHPPALMLRLAALIGEGFDVAIASRYQPGARVVGLAPMRVFLSFAASTIFRAAFPIRGVRDYTCGYRAYRARALKCAFEAYGRSLVEQDGFACMVDILLKMRNRGLVFGELPIVLRYDRKRGVSKMPVLKTIASTLGLLARTPLS